MIVYDGLWALLDEKQMTQRSLSFVHEISPSRLQAMRKGEYITVRTLEKLCRILDCPPEMLIRLEEDHEIQQIVQLAQEAQDEEDRTDHEWTDQCQYDDQTAQK